MRECHPTPTDESSSPTTNGKTPCSTAHPTSVRVGWGTLVSPHNPPVTVVNELCERLTFYGLATKYGTLQLCHFTFTTPTHTASQATFATSSATAPAPPPAWYALKQTLHGTPACFTCFLHHQAQHMSGVTCPASPSSITVIHHRPPYSSVMLTPPSAGRHLARHVLPDPLAGRLPCRCPPRPLQGYRHLLHHLLPGHPAAHTHAPAAGAGS